MLAKITLVAFAAPLALAAANMVPNYEVHLLMNPTVVLGSDHKLTATVLSTFAMPTSVTKMNVQYLDTAARDIYNQGWSPRIRNMENDNGLDLTYKKRYSVATYDMAGINAALTTANSEGFDITDTNYDAQVEIGYSKLTLSMSIDKSASESGLGDTDLPGKKDSRTMLINNIPGKFDDWVYNGWGTDELGDAIIYGPVLAKRSIGTWNSTQLYIEVWPIQNSTRNGIEYIVEASFKEDVYSTAMDKKVALQSFLQGKGWFLAQDSLKTSEIMNNYN
ncbi:hypothetical protein GQ53DRAFT_637610 [Thozetella sp. PMI_491]|nr:hypothetical protein GQ53DRAFT_637610 [Thozetella sp. PMI_491]